MKKFYLRQILCRASIPKGNASIRLTSSHFHNPRDINNLQLPSHPVSLHLSCPRFLTHCESATSVNSISSHVTGGAPPICHFNMLGHSFRHLRLCHLSFDCHLIIWRQFPAPATLNSLSNSPTTSIFFRLERAGQGTRPSLNALSPFHFRGMISGGLLSANGRSAHT
jgi:hypothetical protein